MDKVFWRTTQIIRNRISQEFIYGVNDIPSRVTPIALRSLSTNARRTHNYIKPIVSSISLGIGFGAAVLYSNVTTNCINAKSHEKVPDEFETRYHEAKGPNPVHFYNFIADIVDKTAPAVVRIEIPVFHPFFNQPIGTTGGSGFIVSSDGLIVTNAHVVANQTRCTVRLADGRELKGIVEAVDERIDLASIRIKEKDLPIIKLGSSNSCRPGEWIVALGSPLQLSNSITHGIISSVTRRSEELGQWTNMSYIQTDAAINQGNSGGPLVNLNAEAIGVNSMKLAGTEGIAFAIPSDYVKEFLKRVDERKKQLASRKSGSISPTPLSGRRYIGVTMLTIDPRQMDQIRAICPDLPVGSQGVLVMKIVSGSPAHQAGLEPYDVITTVNGKSVAGVNEVYDAIQSNNTLVFGVKRGARDIKLTVQVEEIA
jgi:HtrA serine peptidase 2